MEYEQQTFTDTFYKEIDRYKPLTLKQERENFVKFNQTGNTLYKNNIIQSNLKWVYKIAHKYKNRGVDFAELICEGNDGIMIAFDKFDHEHYHNKFFTYATSWIEYKIRDRVLKEKTRYENNIVRNVVVADGVHGNAVDSIYENTSVEQVGFCNELLECLTAQEKGIMKMLFGMNRDKPMGLNEVGEVLGFSGEYIRTVRDSCIDKMRCFVLENNIEFDL